MPRVMLPLPKLGERDGTLESEESSWSSSKSKGGSILFLLWLSLIPTGSIRAPAAALNIQKAFADEDDEESESDQEEKEEVEEEIGGCLRTYHEMVGISLSR